MADGNERQSFLSTFGDVGQYLEASESEAGNKTPDITTDLGSSTDLGTPSPLPNLTRSQDKLRMRMISKEATISEESTNEGPENEPGHPDTPLPHADTPLPAPGDRPSSSNLQTESSDEITVHQDSDSLNTEALQLMAGAKSSDFAVETEASSDHSKELVIIYL